MTAPIAAPAELRDAALGQRLDGLSAAVEAARGRVDDETLAPADDLAGRASERLRMSGEHTIVALAGATGSGKSSLFNALTDMELAGVGVRRPTTSWALACAWGPDGAGELLTWMGIPARHQVSRMGMLDRGDDTSLEGLILLDLPDHDSTEVSHHLEMDRLVTYSDLLIWVLDPQKYADAAIHERYIRPMAAYGAVTLVVLNQIDRIPAEQRDETIADVKRLIEADGLTQVDVLGVSATRGDGLEDLRRQLATRIRAKSTAKQRLAADVGDAAKAIAVVGGTAPAPTIESSSVTRLEDQIADQIGLHHAVDSMSSTTRRRIVRRTRWPLIGLFSRSKAGLAADGPGSVSASAVDVAIRDLVEEVTGGQSALAQPWRTSMHAAVDSDAVAASLVARLDQPDLRADKLPLWSRFVQVVQWLLMIDVLAGLVGLGLFAVEKWTDLESKAPKVFDWLADLPEPLGYPLAAWLLGGAVIAGIVLDLLGRFMARGAGRRRAKRLADAHRTAISEVVDTDVVAPMRTELERYSTYRDGLLIAAN